MGVLGINNDILVYGVRDTMDAANTDHDRILRHYCNVADKA